MSGPLNGLYACRLGECGDTFAEDGQRCLHEAMDWHCPDCGDSNGEALVMANLAMRCMRCHGKHLKAKGKEIKSNGY